MPDSNHTQDDLLGGLVRLIQPRQGQRASADAIMLAAAVQVKGPGREPARVLELGCGVGPAMLCLAARLKNVQVTGVELQSDLVTLCRRNIEANGLTDRLVVKEGDIRSRIAGVAPGSFDHVFANPPYYDTGRHRVSPHAGRALARSEGARSEGVRSEVAGSDAGAAELSHWIAALLRHARSGGGVTLIHPADRLGDILAGLGAKAGAIRVIPLFSRAGQPAKRVIVRAIKGSKAPLVLDPGVVLHQAGNSYVPEIEAVLRDGAAFPA
jgi:tRNA1(Val) A37 N6-methylase TrmN6